MVASKILPRKRILFACESISLAHVGRPLALAESLDTRTYDVQIACDPRYAHLVKAAGYQFHALPSMDPKEAMMRLASGAPLYDESTLKQYVADDRKLLKQLNPDLIVGDFRISMGITSQLENIPFANVCNAHWSPYSTLTFPVPELPITRFLGTSLSKWVLKATMSTAMKIHAQAYNRVSQSCGLKRLPSLPQVYSQGTWTLFPDSPRVNPTSRLPENCRYLGPVNWSPKIKLPSWWTEFTKSTASESRIPLLYVTLGSSGDVAILQALMQAIARLPVKAVVASAGRAMPVNVPENVRIAPYLPGSKVLKQCDVAIFNGGAATGYQALEAGVPVLGFPSNADQFYFMQSVQRTGAGEFERPSQTTASSIYNKLKKLIESPTYRANAKQHSVDIARMPFAENFKQFLNEVFPIPASTNVRKTIHEGHQPEVLLSH